MSAPALAPSDGIAFDAVARSSRSEHPLPLGGVPRALREAAELQGIDPVAELFNEALSYANDGHLRLARERLGMLVCLAPDDAQARLLLARVHVAAGRWRDATTALEEAVAAGVTVPATLRRAVEDATRGEEAGADEDRAAMRARELGELKSLRQEARRLRAENAQLDGRSLELEREARRWVWATAAVAGAASVFLAVNLLLGVSDSPTEVASVTPSAPSAPAAAAVVEAPAPVPAAPVAAPPAAPTAADLAQAAASALAASSTLAGSELEVEVDGTRAKLMGSVLTTAQRSTARTLVGQVDGVTEVDSAGVSLLARKKGATHTVASGENLGKIAQLYYGESSLTAPILTANRATLPSASKMQIGQVLKIPAVD